MRRPRRSARRPAAPRAAARAAVLAAVAATAGACARGESRPVAEGGDAAPGARREVVALTPGVPDPAVRATRPPYQVVALAGAGSVRGTVVVDGELPPAPEDAARDSALRADPALARACGRAARPPAPAEGAVVWLEGVAAGKPMPASRRYELALDGCRLAPAALAAAAGGALNVHGVDPLPSRLVFARAGGGPDAGAVLLRTAMSAPGQIVPDERVLAEPGLVEARGEAPAWLRAWVLAFDHPYFAAAGPGGAFTLADVPPGRYTLVAWHPRLGRTAQAVEVAAGQAAAATVTLRAPAR